MAEVKEKEEKKISMDIDSKFGDYVLEEGANTSINIRKISWEGRPFKLDIRKYQYKDGKEIPLKGITLTDKGVNELSNVLVEKGYGDTDKLLDYLRARDDFPKSNSSLEDEIDSFEDEEDDDSEFHNASELIETYNQDDE